MESRLQKREAKATAACIKQAGEQWLDALADVERLKCASRQSPKEEVLLERREGPQKYLELAAQKYRKTIERCQAAVEYKTCSSIK